MVTDVSIMGKACEDRGLIVPQMMFEVKIPNAATHLAMKELDEDKGELYEDFDGFREAMTGRGLSPSGGGE